MEIFAGAQNRYQIGYHVVWGVKYHKHLLNNAMKRFLLDTTKHICLSYDYHFYCLGIAPNHVHLFVGAPPKVAPADIVRVVKSLTARALFKKFPQLRKSLWGGEMWKDGYYVGTVGEGQTEEIVRRYVERQETHQEPTAYLKQMRFFL